MSKWVDLTNVWQEIERIAHERTSMKQNYASHRPTLNNGAHDVIGVAGEYIFERLSGLPMDKNLYLGGDRGRDFGERIEVKSTGYNNPRWLLLFPDEFEKYPDDILFVLVAVDQNKKGGRVIGWTTKDNMKFNKNFQFGRISGPRYYCRTADMIRGIPNVLQSRMF